MDIDQRLSALWIVRVQWVSLIDQLIQEIEKLKKEIDAKKEINEKKVIEVVVNNSAPTPEEEVAENL